MRLRTLSVIALSNRDFPSFDDKLAEAIRWIDLAAYQKSQLVVLPEYLNCYCGDGPGNPLLQTPKQMAFDDWQSRCSVLIEAARRHQIFLTIPVVNKREEKLYNSLFLISPEGKLVWTYDKISPTPDELENGVTPGLPTDPFYGLGRRENRRRNLLRFLFPGELPSSGTKPGRFASLSLTLAGWHPTAYFRQAPFLSGRPRLSGLEQNYRY